MKQKVIKLKVGTVGTGGTGIVESLVAGKGLIVDNTDIANPIISSDSFYSVDEGNGFGIRKISQDTNNHGPIGLGAVDLTTSSLPSITIGSLGNSSFAAGDSTIAKNYASTGLGKFNKGIDVNTILEIGIGTNDASRLNALEVFTDGTLTAPESTIPLINSRGPKTLITKEFADATYTGGGTPSTGLELLNEGNGDGWRLIGRDNTLYGNIGLDAIDLSTSTTASTTLGATGTGAFAIGYENTSFGSYTFASGLGTTAQGDYSSTFGTGTLGAGQFTLAMGNNTIAQNSAMFAGGKWNIGTDINTIFEIGIGTSGVDRRNALEIYNNGLILAPELLIAEIDADPTGKSLVTKEWVQILGTPTGLFQADDGNGYGWRFIGKPTTYNGPIGYRALDLSYTVGTSSNPLGPTASYSTTMGINTEAHGLYAFAIGRNSIADERDSYAIGIESQALAEPSFAIGTGVRSINPYQMNLGTYNIGTSLLTAFEFGIGTNLGNTKNAMEMFFTGEITAPEMTIALINAETSGKVLTTREWVEAQIAGGPTANDFLTGGIFNTLNGELTLNVSNQPDVVIDLDGRYLESFTETDPIFSASAASGITNTQITNWDTAYGWGDHSGLYSLLGHTHLLSDITNVTAEFYELNLLDLNGLTTGWVLAADTASTASWRKLKTSELNNDSGWGVGTGDVTAGAHANNRVAVWTATSNQIEGLNTLVFSDTNQLAVGHSSPSERLDVNGYVIATGYKTPGGLSTQFIKADGSLDSSAFMFTLNQGDNRIPYFTPTSNQVETDATFVYSGGKLGIGTSTPGSGIPYDVKLHLKGSGSGTTGRTAFQVENTNSSSGARFAMVNNLGNEVGFQMNGSTYAVNPNSGIISTTATDLYIRTDGDIFSNGTSDIYFATGGYSVSPFIVYTSDKKVGIGNLIPSERLDVTGYVIATGYKTPGGLSTEYLMADGSVSTGSSGGQVDSIVQGLGITVDNTDPVNPIISSQGLKYIDETNGFGWRLLQYPDANYGNIGLRAVDFSYSAGASTTRGATGENSFAIGIEPTASGKGSFASGNTTVANGFYSAAFGYHTTANGNQGFAIGSASSAGGISSFAGGNSSISSFDYSFTFGEGVISGSDYSFNVGRFNDNSETGSAFEVGIGTSGLARLTGFKVLRTKEVVAPEMTEALIDSYPNGRVLVTREWVENNSGGGSGVFSFNVNQVGIGLTVSVGDVISLVGSTYVLANATDDTKEAIGVVTEVTDNDNIVFQNAGQFNYLPGGLTIGATYYLDTTDGNVTITEPVNYIQPVWTAIAADQVILQIGAMFVLEQGPNLFTDLDDKDGIDQAATNKGNISGSITFDMTNNNIYATLTGDVTDISFTNEPSATDYRTAVLTITQDATTAYAMDWTGSGVVPETGVVAADLEPNQVLGSITQYWLYWAGHLGYWTIAKMDIETTAL